MKAEITSSYGQAKHWRNPKLSQPSSCPIHWVHLRTAVSHQFLQYTSTEESIYPRSIIHAKAGLKGLDSDVESIETTSSGCWVCYWQTMNVSWTERPRTGTQSKVTDNKREVHDKMRKLTTRDMDYEQPEAHVTLKFFGLRSCIPLMKSMSTKLLDKLPLTWLEIQAELARGMTFEYFKILDLMGSDYAFLLNLACQFTWDQDLPLLPITKLKLILNGSLPPDPEWNSPWRESY